MSGCVNCVWDMFRDELEEWAAAKKEATERGMAAQGMDEDGGGSAMMAADTGAVEDLFEGIPVGIREFMKTEKKLKERLRAKETVAG